MFRDWHAGCARRLEGPATDGVERGAIEQRVAAAAVERDGGRHPINLDLDVDEDDPLFPAALAGERVLGRRVVAVARLRGDGPAPTVRCSLRRAPRGDGGRHRRG